MESKDLRIGNIVKSGKGIYRIYALSHPMILAIQSVEFKIDSEKGVFSSDSTILEPIPLSEDILLKCGFVDGKIETEQFIFSIHFYDGWNIDFKEKSGYGATEFTTVGFPFLHQLQNLYYTLTGKELEINL